MGMDNDDLGPSELQAARRRISGTARMTPLLVSEQLTSRFGRNVTLKCENLQLGGAFKIRGATNFIARLGEATTPRGLVTYSSGNHALAVSIAAQRAGVPAVVVMPETAPPAKLALVRARGAEIHQRGTTTIERRTLAESVEKERGFTMVPPFDHPWIVAGQASCGMEVLDQMPDVQTILVPVGGGGLLSGVAVAAGHHGAGVRVIGVEPEGAACMAASLRAGAPVTLPSVASVADGLLPVRPGDLNFSIARRRVSEVVTVTDDAIRESAVWILKNEHLLVEWSGAVGLAALISGAVRNTNGPVAIVLSGGNVDPGAILGSTHESPASG